MEKQMLSTQTTPLNSILRNSISTILSKTKDRTLNIMLQKLEAIAMEEGLDCDISNMECFISSGMFYVEIKLDSCGLAKDVKIHWHTGVLQKCEELITCLKNKDFREFRSHLQALKSRYMLNCDNETTSAILSVLTVLENDIMKVMQADRLNHHDTVSCIMKGSVGFISPPVGGKSISLTFCIDPLITMSVKKSNESVQDLKLIQDDFTVLLSVRPSLPSSLPISSIITLDNNKLSFVQEDNWSVKELPATLVLQFVKPMSASVHIAKLLHSYLKKGNTFVHCSKINVDQLLYKQHAGETFLDSLEYTCKLPDCELLFHCTSNDIPAILLSSIPFNNASQLNMVMKVLRCQAVFNVLFTSFFQIGCKTVLDHKGNSTKQSIDIMATDWNLINVSFLHPIDSSITSIDLLVTLEGIVECTLNVLPGSDAVCSNTYLDTVTNKCLSIPVMMRSFFKQATLYKPNAGSNTLQPEKKFNRPTKLLMPSLSQIQSGMSLVSPHINSPSAFLTFSAGISPHTPVFPFEGENKSLPSSRKRTISLSTGGTPNSDGGRTPSKLKLPKITLKRKRNQDSEIYEIDQTKTVIEPTAVDPPPLQDKTQPYVYPDFSTGPIDIKHNPSIFSESVSFPDLPLDGDTDIEGLFGIPPEPFISETEGSTQVAAFDLDIITSGGDASYDQFKLMETGAIDPSNLVNVSSAFELDASEIIDIDSLMNTDN